MANLGGISFKMLYSKILKIGHHFQQKINDACFLSPRLALPLRWCFISGGGASGRRQNYLLQADWTDLHPIRGTKHVTEAAWQPD